jgi:hypothetical protein
MRGSAVYKNHYSILTNYRIIAKNNISIIVFFARYSVTTNFPRL